MNFLELTSILPCCQTVLSRVLNPSLALGGTRLANSQFHVLLGCIEQLVWCIKEKLLYKPSSCDHTGCIGSRLITEGEGLGAAGVVGFLFLESWLNERKALLVCN